MANKVTMLMGAALAAMLGKHRMDNKMGSLFFDSFRGVGRKSSLRRKPQSIGKTPGSGNQECFRRRNGGFYDVRKRSIFP